MQLYNKRFAIAAIACVTCLGLLIFSHNFASSNDSKTVERLRNLFPGLQPETTRTTHDTYTIPNIIHFVIATKSEDAPIKLNLLAFLSIYSAALSTPTAEIWLHTNASSAMIERATALEGLAPPVVNPSGSQPEEYEEYWTQAVVKGVKRLQIKPLVKQYSSTVTGQQISKLANWSDFVRADILYEHGGAFLDLDVISLRDISPLLKTGFHNILARDVETQCGVFMSSPRSHLIRAYRHFMEQVYNPYDYAFHATSLLHVLRQTFARVPNELLMLSDSAFYPISWDFNGARPGAAQLWSIHDEDLSDTEELAGDLSHFEYDTWIKHFIAPSRGTYEIEPHNRLDLSETYLLHVYHSQFSQLVDTGVIRDFTNSAPSKLAQGLTLPLILEGSSFFARAVLKTVSHAIEHGIISVAA